ncbi:MAG: 5-oxoprolinase subunit PxpB, partial [Candidatus Neomarinimicrobiota bacterium]|nr:5-oxoprolinase subunit PxpB [Candidatus Neomarinimicrobiota bacterium]
DRSILVKFGHEISEEFHQRVFAFTDFVLNNRIKSVVNIHPAYSSVLFTIDLNADLKETLSFIKESWLTSTQLDIPKMRQVKIPVLYGGKVGKDMNRISQYTGLNQSEIIQCHEGGLYKVYFTGFSPGFPYIGGMDPSLSTPRLTTPRKQVPAGTIGIAAEQTGIYPLSSPGGWNLIGQTPIKIFDWHHPTDLRLRMGDNIKFISITKEKFDQLKENVT